MKNDELYVFFHPWKKTIKTLLAMKLIFIFTGIFTMTLNASVLPQGTRMSIDAKDEPIRQVLQEIESKSDYRFFYNDQLANLDDKINFKVENLSEFEAIKVLFSEQNLTFRLMENNLVLVVPVLPQQNIITGTVKDKNGEPVPGASVFIKGTTKGVVTNLDGAFSIEVSDETDILVFSFVGMKTQEIQVGNQTSIDVVLEEDIIGLEELVVIGYGSVKRSDLTGSVGSVEGDVISQSTITDVTRTLQGRVAGVDIEQNVGKPGGTYDITIRGLSSINNTNTPLFVIDGIPTTEGLTDLNPTDIEDIDILKDASATAIYGSRGANGVIIVSTKKGQQGKFSIQYDGYYGYRTPANLPDMMNGDEYVQWRTDLFTYQGKSTDRSNTDFFRPDEWNIIDSGNYTDWLELILRNGVQTSNTITLSGGDESGTFAMSIGQLKEEGTVPGQDFNRYNLRLNHNRKFGEKWEAGGNLYFTYSLRNEGSYETLRSTFRMPPVAKPYDANGDPQYRSYREDYTPNPLFEFTNAGEIREHRRYRAFGNIFLQFKPVQGLTLRSQLAPQMIYSRQGQQYGQFAKNGGQGSLANASANYRTTDYFGYVMDNMLNYTKDINNHTFDLGIIQSLQLEQWEEAYQSARDFPYTSKWYNLDAVTRDNISASETDYRKRTLSSVLGRLQYTYSNKYLFTVSGRYDGSSRLAAGNKWAFFPSAAFAWRISEESFLDNSSTISNLKLRLSYGVTGNDAVDIYGTQSNITQMNYNYDGVMAIGYYKNGLANQNLTWEKTNETNVGIDYGLFNYRINGSLDVYRRDSKGLIMKRQLPQTSGWSDIFDNIGWVKNSGIELGLNTVNVQSRDFSWTTGIVFTRNKNEIIELIGGKKDDVANKWFIGEPIRVNYDYEFDGIWQSDEATEAATYGQTPGEVKVKDQNNDGVIDADDRTIIGQRTPKWSGSITNTLTYKNWDFSAYIYTRQGQQLYSTFKASFMALEGNYNNVAVDYWTAQNPSNEHFQPGNKGNYFNAWRYSDISFVRVGTIALGYTLPKRLLDRVNIDRLRIYCSVTNPFTFTSYPGYDPEWADQNTWGEATGYSTYLFGVNLEL